MHRNLFFPEGSETPFSENQIKLLVKDGMTEYRSSGKKHCPDGGDNESGKPEDPQTKFQKNCAALCSWQDTADTNSVLGKSKASISEAAEVQQTKIGLRRPPTFLVSTPSSTTVGSKSKSTVLSHARQSELRKLFHSRVKKTRQALRRENEDAENEEEIKWMRTTSTREKWLHVVGLMEDLSRQDATYLRDVVTRLGRDDDGIDDTSFTIHRGGDVDEEVEVHIDFLSEGDVSPSGVREATAPKKRVATGHGTPSGGGGAESAIVTGVASLPAVLNDSVTNMKAVTNTKAILKYTAVSLSLKHACRFQNNTEDCTRPPMFLLHICNVCDK